MDLFYDVEGECCEEQQEELEEVQKDLEELQKESLDDDSFVPDATDVAIMLGLGEEIAEEHATNKEDIEEDNRPNETQLTSLRSEQSRHKRTKFEQYVDDVATGKRKKLEDPPYEKDLPWGP
jgi:hypothetical protein